MEFGPLIKYYRTQKGLTQKELAEGICSIPHLSKIEHNSKEGNKETIALLLERLGVKVEEAESKDEEIKSLLEALDDKMNFYIKTEVDCIFSRLTELEGIIPFSSHIYTYELYKYRYMLFMGLMGEAESQQDLLRKQAKNFSRRGRTMFDYFSGIHLLLKAKYFQADAIFEKLEGQFTGSVNVGEFLYHRAFAKSHMLQAGHTIHFGKKALQQFMEQHNFKRILHALMLLGINYTHLKIYEEASACFGDLIRNAELLNEQALLPHIYHNMGFLQKKMNKPPLAIHFFEKGLAIHEGKGEPYLVTLYALGETKHAAGDMAGAERCFQEVLSLAETLSSKKYRLLASFYLMLESSDPYSFEYLETKVIPFLEDGKEHRDDLAHFYRLLANHYSHEGSFEKAVCYLSKIS